MRYSTLIPNPGFKLTKTLKKVVYSAKTLKKVVYSAKLAMQRTNPDCMRFAEIL
jgi:hypothetical protein